MVLLAGAASAFVEYDKIDKPFDLPKKELWDIRSKFLESPRPHPKSTKNYQSSGVLQNGFLHRKITDPWEKSQNNPWNKQKLGQPQRNSWNVESSLEQ